MTDVKITPEKRIKVVWLPVSGVADYTAPTATELNAGLDLSRAIAWDGFEIGAQDSSDIDDAAITDEGNAVEAGFDQFGATIPLFYPGNMTDPSSDYVLAYEAFKTQNVNGWLYVRILGGLHTADFADGQWVSGYRVVSDYTMHDTEGEDSVKFIVEFLPQGLMKQNAMVASADAPVLSDATLTMSVGDVDMLTATLEGYDVTQGSEWESDDPTVATVTPNGVVVALAAGTADITATHPSGSATSTACVVTVS